MSRLPARSESKASRISALTGVLLAVWILGSTALATSLAAEQAPLEAAVQLMEEGRLADAESRLRSLLEERQDPVLHDLLGVTLSRLGRLEEAEDQFEQALARDPNFLDGRQHLARLYLLQQRRPAAAEQLRAAAALGPLERDLAMTLAGIELEAGNGEAASRQLQSVAERFDSVRALLQLARLVAAGGEIDQALQWLQRAREIAPASEEVLATQARESLAAGLPVPAILALEPLTRMYPSVAEYPYLMGIARMNVGDLPGSIESLRRSLEIEPDRAPALVGLGLTLNHQKRHAEAKEALARSLVLDPDNVNGLAALAESEAGLSELESAERHALRALAQQPDHPTANLALGQIRMQQGRHGEARQALVAAIAADPQSDRAHYQLSLTLARLGDREASRRHLEIYRQILDQNEARQLELQTNLGPAGEGNSP